MKGKSVQEIQEFLTPYASSLNLEIVEVAFKISKEPTLTIFIDKDGGVDLNACEEFHNLINAPLDELDPYPTAYTLNVSSPGVDRPLKTQKDFEKRIGKQVEVKLFAPIKGKKYFEGRLVNYNGNTVTVEQNGEEIVLEITKIAKINEAIVF